MNDTRGAIRDELRAVEREQHARVLLAVQAGSRAWGFEAPDSDFDVRFIYVRPAGHYLRLDPARDVIEWRLDEVFDINGWDLAKALRLLRDSNPSMFEWLTSPIVYTEHPLFEAVREVAPGCFSPTSGIHHYLSMARSSRAALTGQEVSLKKYLYATRALLGARWIAREQTPIPMLFRDLMEAQLEPSMRGLLTELLIEKAEAREHHRRPRIGPLDAWFETTTADLEERLKHLTHRPKLAWDQLNAVFRDIVVA